MLWCARKLLHPCLLDGMEERWALTQICQVVVDPALGVALFAVRLAQTLPAGLKANRRGVLDSSRLYKP